MTDSLSDSLKTTRSSSTSSRRRSSSSRSLPKCPNCSSSKVTRSHQNGLDKVLYALLNQRPYRCKSCQRRFHAAISRNSARARQRKQQRKSQLETFVRVGLASIVSATLLYGFWVLIHLTPVPEQPGIKNQLETAQNILTTSLNDPNIQQYLAKYGYDRQRIELGQGLYQKAQIAQNQQLIQKSAQNTVQAQVATARVAVSNNYKRLVKIAQVAFKNNPEVAQTLNLSTPEPAQLTAWLTQIQNFYRDVLAQPQILAELGVYGITRAQVEAEQTQIVSVQQAQQALLAVQQKSIPINQQRDQTLKTLQDWLKDYLIIAQVALEDQPALWDKFGVPKGR